MSQDLNDWSVPEEETPPITLAQMDSLLQELHNRRAYYEEMKAKSGEAYKLLQEAEQKVLGALKHNGKNKYELEGVGTVYISHKETWSTPKDVESKRKLFTYIQDKYGRDTLDGLIGINHQTLNAWANRETESGEVMEIPGLAAPTAQEILNFRRR